MRARRLIASALATVVIGGGAALVAPLPASADGTTPVPVTCTGIPLVGSIQSTANVTATDDVDPVAPGGTVVDKITVPIPVGNIPITATVTEVKLKINIPSGVTVNNVAFTASSFSSQTYSIASGVLTATLSGSVPIGGSNPTPTVPDVTVTTTIGGSPRTVEWKVPTQITAKASSALGAINATCTPDDLTTTLISTTVAATNHAPVATDKSVTVPYQTATPITLAGTDADSDPLTFAMGATSPAHGTLTGTMPNLTYTPANGYSGPDSFTFTVSDGLLSDIGTVSITVSAPVNHAPVATDKSVNVPYQTATPITLTGTDVDLDALTFALGATSPSHGNLTGTAPNLTYTPANGYSGPDSFTFTVSDGVLSDVGTISITVAAPHAPTATDQVKNVPYQTATPITVAGTDPDGDPLTFSLGATSPAHGNLTGTFPNVTYTPNAGYIGDDSFEFKASDGVNIDAGIVTIHVVPTVPAAPTMGTPTVQDGQVTLNWTAPSNTGGSPILSWIVTPKVGGVAQTPIAVPGGGTTSTVVPSPNGVARTFVVAAVNSIGTGAASVPTSAVTPQWWLPWTSGNHAVADLFTWFTGVAPTASELSIWLTDLNAGTKNLGDLVTSIRGAADATKNVDPTTRLYSAYFVRIPDRSGLVHWLNKRRGGMKLAAISDQFAHSSEFKNRYGSLTNEQFVKQIYLNVQGREGEATGIAYWTNQLNTHKKGRGQVMLGFSESHEYVTKQVNKINAAVVWIFMLGKAPTTVQRDAFVADVVGATLPAEVRSIIRTNALLPPRVS
jgi:hypothetical protein